MNLASAVVNQFNKNVEMRTNAPDILPHPLYGVVPVGNSSSGFHKTACRVSTNCTMESSLCVELLNW